MEQCHKELVIKHLRRLHRIISEHDESSIGQYTHKQAAREQLARVTLIIRDYMRIPYTDNMESMVADVVDGSYYVEGTQDTYNQPIFVNSALFSREQELAVMIQEQSAESVDDVIELWNVIPEKSNKVLPDSCPRADIGCDIDWNEVLCKSRSESNLLHHFGHLQIEDIDEWKKDLHTRKLEELDLHWPPVFKDPKPNVGWQRERSNTSSMPASRAESKAREAAMASTPSSLHRRPTFGSPTPLSPFRSRAVSRASFNRGENLFSIAESELHDRFAQLKSRSPVIRGRAAWRLSPELQTDDCDDPEFAVD